MLNQKELNNLLQEAILKVEEAGIKVDRNNIIKTVRISSATGYYGLCSRRVEGFRISISQYHLTNPENAILQTLVHEVLHTVEGCMNHGNKWKSLANKINLKHGYNISRLGTARSGVKLNTPPSVYKYIIECQDCSNKYKRKRRSKLTNNPEHYRCGKCNGELKLKK